jgi:ABC-type transport system substrate-binding protein
MYPNLDPARFTGASYAARRAIAEAIGRGGIANGAFFGTAIPASTLLSSGADHFDPQLGDFFGGPADPEEAAQYLEEAGGPPQEPLGLHLIDDPYLLDTAVMVQADLAAAGIPVAIFVESTSQVVERLTVTREYDLVLLTVEVQAASRFRRPTRRPVPPGRRCSATTSSRVSTRSRSSPLATWRRSPIR